MSAIGAYLVLADWRDRADDNSSPGLDHHIQSIGMSLRTRLGAARVFASTDCPTLILPSGICLIGNAYSRQGQHIHDVSQLPRLSTNSEVEDFILSKLWGEYVLVGQSPADPRAFTVLRSPSHACELGCLYSLDERRAFVTSDITLATGLGLYERTVNFDAVIHRLVFPDIKTSRSALAGIRELLPGQILHASRTATRLTQAWSPWHHTCTEQRYADVNEAAQSVRAAIEMVVRTLANRDDSVLLELSGGLDSSVVAAALRHTSARVHCSTLATPIPGSDESDYAASVAAMLGVKLSTIQLGFDDARFDFPLPPQLIAPPIGPLQYAADKSMQKEAERCGTRSSFSGAGGDTVFCFVSNASPAADAFRGGGLATGIKAIGDLSSFHQCTYWKAAQLTLKKLVKSGPLFKPDQTFLLRQIGLPEPLLHPWSQHPPHALPGERQRIFELAATQSFHDVCPRAVSRPVRMPLLTQPVIEACLRAPTWMWFDGGQNRAIVRQAFADVLPRKIINRRSKGSFTAFLGALYRRNRNQMLDFLLDGQLQAHGLLDTDALQQLATHDPGPRDSAFMRVLELSALENWVRQQ